MKITEKQFQSKVEDLARVFGWMLYHTYDSRRSQPGFPDLVIVRETVLFRELKTEKGRVTQTQREWGIRLEKAGADYAVWRPSHWDEIVETLKK